MKEPKYSIVWTTQFKKDYKRAMKRHLDINLLDDIIRKLSYGEPLLESDKDHALTGNWSGFQECHIEPDWRYCSAPYQFKNSLSFTVC